MRGKLETIHPTFIKPYTYAFRASELVTFSCRFLMLESLSFVRSEQIEAGLCSNQPARNHPRHTCPRSPGSLGADAAGEVLLNSYIQYYQWTSEWIHLNPFRTTAQLPMQSPCRSCPLMQVGDGRSPTRTPSLSPEYMWSTINLPVKIYKMQKRNSSFYPSPCLTYHCFRKIIKHSQPIIYLT